MTVKEFIEYLSTQPQELQVAYKCCSEYDMLETRDIEIKSLCLPRPDGWIADRRPDKDCMEYLVLPGN